MMPFRPIWLSVFSSRFMDALASEATSHTISALRDLLDPFEISICILCFVGVFAFVKFRKPLQRPHYQLRDTLRKHDFVATDIFAHPWYCNVCELSIVEGFSCGTCSVTVHPKCAAAADRKFPCKAMSSYGPTMKHHLVKGNLPLDSTCAICKLNCGNAPRLCDFRCVWCKQCYHETCQDLIPEECDLGPYRNYIIPPNCVKVKLVGLRPRRQTVVSSLSEPQNPDWMPLIIIGNKRSGAGDSAAVLRLFKGALNPGQVIDVNAVKPEQVLGWVNLLPNHTCRILVCGGDGTVGWILNTIEDLKLSPAPAVGVIPIGTGNDLSNVLGWGSGAKLPVSLDEVIQKVTSARVCSVDRWQVQITSTARHLGIPHAPRKIIWNNYASLGVDALVTLNFHRNREKIPPFFASRLANKLVYFTYGTVDVLERACMHLDQNLSLKCDGVPIELPPLEGLVFLNIPSWGAGVNVWNLDRNGGFEEQRIDDGKFEVFAVSSSFHIAQMQVGLAKPHRLCQATSAELTLRKITVPMQVDGEPWEQGPAVITISFHNKGLVLSMS